MYQLGKGQAVAAAIAASACFATSAFAAKADKKVFAHYMVGDSTTEHRHQDILDAKAMGLDGFSLNIGDPTQDFVRSSLNDMFDFAAANDFTLHISMDLWAAGDAKPKKSVEDYHDLFTDFLGHSAWQSGANGHPLVTTFADGGLTNKTWQKWRDSFGNKVFLIPDFDGTKGYYSADPGWWEYWSGVVDGLFSWEASWPTRNGKGGSFPGDISPDEPVIQGVLKRNKHYMIGLSPIQYKNAYETNIYRQGQLNLPERMFEILEHANDIQYVDLITWNDGPESHYVGNIWPEQNDDVAPNLYMKASHTGWQRLIGSFITAFKNKSPASAMRPFGSDTVTGAYWYRSILTSNKCDLSAARYSTGLKDFYLEKPEGFDKEKDVAAYAIVLPDGASGWSLKVTSGGKVDTITGLKAGLNYGNAELKAGVQRAEIVDSSGKTVAVASGGRCVYGDTCPDCIYNMNPTVLKFGDAKDDQKCDETCSGPQNGSDIVFIDPGIWTMPNPGIGCVPPCTIILPPESLSTATTISIPPVTETMEETFPSATKDGTVIYGTKTITTVITVPVITTSVIDYSNIVWNKTQGVSTTDIIAWYSIEVPRIILTDKDHPEITWTYSYGPWPPGTTVDGVTSTNGGGSGTTTNGGSETTTKDGSGTTTQGGGGVTKTDKPPKSMTRGTIPVSSGTPKPTCNGSGCGNLCHHNCDGPPGVKIPPPSISIPCIGLGCGSGSNGGSNNHNCVGSGCEGGGGGGSGGDDDPKSCSTTKTASHCVVSCPAASTAATQTCSTSCFGIRGCDPTGRTTTVTSSITDVPAPYGADDMVESSLDPDWASMSNEQGALATEIWNYWDSLYPEPTTSTSTKKPDPTTTTKDPEPEPTVTYDRDGSGLCKSMKVKYCDHAVNYLQRNDDQTYGTSDNKLDGNCWANSSGQGCKVFVAGSKDGGKECTMSGNEMWQWYQKLRDNGADKCGSVHFGNGCRMTVNYVSSCDNREGNW
ncbi:glycosyl hydrolase family 71-domain-containing protein [Whalleya microplaca]|nr:glycosyl hydrolase family 71-domain-containing protein [Whalleya microplaca]